MVKESPNKAVLIYQDSQLKLKEMKRRFELSQRIDSRTENLYINKEKSQALIRQFYNKKME